ncbi:SPOR domain-containing protein [Litorivicinus lipolyticus]|uniref:SPOR domain-containing protein n=1 Tax=Litorivicinus lipolyticus TaxID=418701 RepID=UPI003B59011F
MSAEQMLSAAQVRHRVIGAIVVLSLLIIVVPWALDPDTAAFDPRSVAIEDVPAAPFVGSPVSPTPMPEATEAALRSAQDLLNPSAPVAGPMPDAWGLQVGSFKNADNAQRLADRLIAADWQGVRLEPKSGFHRVLVGPVRNRADADGLQSQLKREFDLNGRVVRIKP